MRRNLCLAILMAVAIFAGNGRAQTLAPSIGASGVMSTAGLAAEPSDVVAPGSLITILGKNLGTATQSATTNPWPLNLGGTVVQVGSFFAPVQFVSPTQVNAQIPYDVISGTVLPVVVYVNGRASAASQVQVRDAAPGIFTVSQSGVGPAKALHADGSPVGAGSPAITGEEIQIFCSGLGATITSAAALPITTGQPGAGQPIANAPSVRIGTAVVSVTSAVAASGLVGQYIVRVIVPNLTSGDQPLVVAVAGASTHAPVTIPVSGQASSTSNIPGTTGPGGPVVFTAGILNAASLAPAPNNPASPGGLISIFGTTLAANTVAASSLPYPRDLGGSAVFINGIQAPLAMVSASQINAQVPFDIQPGSLVNVVVVSKGISSAPVPLQISPAAPGIFSIAGSGFGPAFVTHAISGNKVSESDPAIPGESLILRATGLGETLVTGGVAAQVTGDLGNGQATILTPTVTVGAQDAKTLDSRSTTDAVGQYFVTFVMPDVTPGDQPITIKSAGNASPATVLIRVASRFPQAPAFLKMHLQGSFGAFFGLKVKSPSLVDPDKELEEIATFGKNVASPGCTIDVSGTSGLTYSAIVHCQDYADPNNLIAVIFGLKNGRFVDNKLVFTELSDTSVNYFIFIGPGQTPTRNMFLVASVPIVDGAVSIDLKRPDFAPGDQNIIGTVICKIKFDDTGTIPAQTSFLGGGFTDTITSVQR